MLMNVIDLREKPYRWKSVVAVVENAAKNNAAEDSDPVETAAGVEIDYAEREDLNVREAILWAEQLQGKVTLYLYDKDGECKAPTTP
ncbi:MAG: hypothetical protein AAF965_02220 [Pseudomonadota bacterium]